MYQLKAGWTKDKVMAQVRMYNKDVKSLSPCPSWGIAACAYMDTDGNRCAIGCFIPDGHQGLAFFGTAYGLFEKYPELLNYMPFDNTEILRLFQMSHDDARGSVLLSIQQWLDNNVQ